MRTSVIRHVFITLCALAAVCTMSLVTLDVIEPQPFIVQANESDAEKSATVFAQYSEGRRTYESSSYPVDILLVGDMMLSRNVESVSKKNGGYGYPFDGTRSLLDSADVVFGNLETPLLEGEPVLTGSMSFRADPEWGVALQDSGVDIVSLANNHTLNRGTAGLLNTIDVLRDAHISAVGAGADHESAHQPVIVEQNGLRFAFLAYSYDMGARAEEHRAGLAVLDADAMQDDVKQIRSDFDFIIIAMHAGAEYTVDQSVSQTEFAHAAIDAGADFVVGHHPHVVQHAEVYKGKYIFYSLGNFIFDQMWSQETREGLALRLVVRADAVESIGLIPVEIQNYAQPRIIHDESQAENILDRLAVPYESYACATWNPYENTTTLETCWKIQVQQAEQFTNAFQTAVADVNQNSIDEQYNLQEGELVVTEENQEFWRSPEHLWVDSFALADADADGALDLALSVWKSGDFGDDMPFWIDQNDLTVKNHFFLYTYDNDELIPLWHSSNLEAPNCQFEFVDTNSDGKKELLVLEGEYDDSLACHPAYAALWTWNGWGFSNQWRSEKLANVVPTSVDYWSAF